MVGRVLFKIVKQHGITSQKLLVHNKNIPRIVKNFYHMIFYHIYKSVVNSGEKSAPTTTSYPILGFLQFCNLMSIIIFLEVFNINVIKSLSNNSYYNYYIIGIATILIIINHIYFSHNNLSKLIIKKYSEKSAKERKKGARITLFYGLGSIMLLFTLVLSI